MPEGTKLLLAKSGTRLLKKEWAVLIEKYLISA